MVFLGLTMTRTVSLTTSTVEVSINNASNFFDDDDHGTHVAGIVIGAGQNIFARPLQESKIKVMPLKFLNGNWFGFYLERDSCDLLCRQQRRSRDPTTLGVVLVTVARLDDAMTYAYDHRVLVVSLPEITL